MTILLLGLMAYHLWGEAAHEWIGAGMLVLFIAHHLLNLNWHKNLFKGKYTAFRTLTLCVDVLILVVMLAQMYSGIAMSRYVFTFLPLDGGMSFARRFHILGSYWGFLLMSLHLGLHWNMIIGMLQKNIAFLKSSKVSKVLSPVIGLAIAGYGVYAFIKRDFLTYLFLKSEFVFLDYSEPKILFYIDYLALMGLCIFIAHYGLKLLKEKQGEIVMDFITLNNDVKMPVLGLGTWFIDDDKAESAVKSAVQMGYRHIDTAQAYGNEAGVGAGVRNCGLPREQLFVVSKVAAEHKTYETASKSIDETLEKMGLEYLDLMIIHSPQPWAQWRGENRYFEENKQVWKALEDAYKAGKLKAIGVSNFLVDDLEQLLSTCEIKPMVNQILAHIGNTHADLIEYCQKQNIAVVAYSPIAHGEALKNETIAEIAKKYNVSAVQLCIKYVLELGMAALPKTSNPYAGKS